MDIAARISELLFDYECVVLPEFGGFITNDKPAQINRITHQFKAPHREILFNVQLTANDGLLAKHISETDSISYKDARQKLDEFVSWCRNELRLGRKVEFAQIGSLFFDDAKNIVFEQDQQINYNPDSFGLDSFVSPVIKRTSQEEKIKGIILPITGIKKRVDRKAERMPDEKQSKSKKTFYRFPVALMSLLLLVILVTSVFMPRQSSVISLSGLFLSSSMESVPEVKPEPVSLNETVSVPDQEIETEIIELEMQTDAKNEIGIEGNNDLEVAVETESADRPKELLIESQPLPESKTVVVETSPAKAEPTIVKSEIKVHPSSKQYYIIAGSFSKEKNAQKLIAQLSEKGYSAIVADTNKNGMYRVAYAGFSSKADAKQELLAIRQDENSDAWLLRK